MANIGGGAAYSQLQPLRNDIAQTFQQWNAIEAQKAADEAQRAHQDKLVKEKRKYDERQELKKGLELPDDAFIAKTTQFQKIDDVYFDAAEKAGERYAENEDAIMQAFDKGEMGEVKRLKNINRRLLTNMELIKEYSELGASTYSNIIKLDNEGKVSPVGKDWVETIDAVANNNFTFEFDADGKMYSKVLKTGDDGTTRIDVYDDPRALVDGRMMPPLVVDTDQFIADWKKTAAVVPIETDINPQTGKKDGNIYSGQAWTPFTEQSARASVGAITKDNKVMADLLYQFEGKDKSDKFDFTAEEYALVQDKLYGKLKAALPEVMNTKTDAATRAYNQSERHFNARMAQDSEKDKANKPLSLTRSSKRRGG